jgi:hypothetical protein
MTALLILGSLACITWLMSLLTYILQRMMGDYDKSMDLCLWQMYSFTVLAMCVITIIMINYE